MSAFWVLTAFAAICIFNALCDTDTSPAGQDLEQTVASGIFRLLCEDIENCPYGPSELEPKPASKVKIENPKVHCIMLRPSAVKMFGEIESRYPGISNIKYQVLEQIVSHMKWYTSYDSENCLPAMQLIELVILAAKDLKDQYELQGGKECTYYSNQTEKPQIAVTEMPCQPESSGYVTGSSKVCPGSTMKPEMTTVSEKPYIPSSTEKPYIPSSTEQPSDAYVPASPEEPSKKVCPDGVTTEKPCQPLVDSVTEESSSEEIEIMAEDELEVKFPQVGSMRGIPGVHYPNYTDIPITSFTCADKKYIPGFYADLETGCQVFHVCYEHRRESFLCPVGTIFNQPILACDYWYSSDCSVACDYYNVNEKTELKEEKIDEEVEELLTMISETEKLEEHGSKQVDVENDLDKIAQFFPVKAIVTDIEPKVELSSQSSPTAEEAASEIVDKMATIATKVISSTRDVIKNIPEPPTLVSKPIELTETVKPVDKVSLPVIKKPIKMKDFLKPIAKAKLVAIPVSKVAAIKTVMPVAGFAAKTKVAIPVAAAKAKLATKVASIPAIKVAAAAPVLAKAKLAAAVPAAKAAVAMPILAKAKIAAAAVPAAKVAVAAPIVKAKVAAIPAAKVAVAAPVIAKGKIVVPAVKVAAAKVAAKSSIPALKTKMVASAIPLAKAKIVPLMKAKAVKSAATPLLKAKVLALPLAKSKLAGPLPIVKVKLAKAAAISPLTKKKLALGYMKLLKAKKLALMG